MSPKRSVDFKDSHRLLEQERHVRLECGHDVREVAVLTYPDGKRAYTCPQGCGIKRETRLLQ